MTTFNTTNQLSLPSDSGQPGADIELNRRSDYERILAFCLKRTTLHHSECLAFSLASPQKTEKIRTRYPSSDDESLKLISELTLLGKRAIQHTAELLDPHLKQLASEYTGSSHNRRDEICEQLYQSLLTQSPPVRTQNEILEHIWDDLSHQSCNRIFARQFMKHGNPNCFGRALIMLAFAQIANATVLGVTPLIPSSELSTRHDCCVARRILKHAQKHKVKLRPELISYLQFIVTRSEMDRLRPLMFHMGLVFLVSPTSWVLIDPHAKVFGKYQNEDMISHIEKRGQSRPRDMFTADFRSETTQESTDQLRQLKSLTRFLRPFQELNSATKGSVGEALLAMAQSELLDFILSDAWNIPQEQKEKIAAQLRGELTSVVDERCLELLLGTQHSRSTLCRIQALLEYCLLLDCGKEFVGLLSFNVSDGTQVLRQEMLTLSFMELLAELIARFHGFMFNHSSFGNEQGLLHPAIELYQPEFRVGVELVSHVNAVTLCSEDVAQKLSCVCDGQSVQLSTATEILRNKKERTRLSSKRAFDKLASADIQSRRLQEVLKRISIKLSHTHIREHEIS